MNVSDNSPGTDAAADPATDDVEAAVEAVRRRFGAPADTAPADAPMIALVLGSGLGVLAEAAEDTTAISTADLPGYPTSTVAGHEGRLVFGRLEGQSVVFIQGRAHLYEGHSVRDVTFPIRLMRGLGVERLLLTNAAGGINTSFKPGTFMLITDHINMTFSNPLVGMPAVPRGVCLSEEMYDRDWLSAAAEQALQLGIEVRQGTYLWTQGPSYETRAEVRAFANMGADVVGMSTVPEVIQARRLGMNVLGISTVTNPAAGLGDEPLDHDDVLEVGKRVRKDLERLVRAIVRTL